MNRYVYNYRGPVLKYDELIDHWWEAETTAESAKKARSNLIYRYKKEHDMASNIKISLPGKLERGK